MNPSDLTHEDIKEQFQFALNIAEPDHPYKTDPYPVSNQDITYSYRQQRSTVYAACGPSTIPYTVSFSADKSFFQNSEIERILAVFAHELTHVTVGNHSNNSTSAHPPEFWREFGFNAHIFLDHWEEFEAQWGRSLSKEDFIGHVIKNEADGYNIDLRYDSVLDRRHEMAKWYKNTLSSNE